MGLENLMIISGIWKGYLDYVPQALPFVSVDGILEDVFNNCHESELVHNGVQCLHKNIIQKGIRRRVRRVLGPVCCVCGVRDILYLDVHHVRKAGWVWGRAFGFVVMCRECHKKLHYNMPFTKKELESICHRISDKGSPGYMPPSPAKDGGSVLTRHRLPGMINYYSLDVATPPTRPPETPIYRH